jgi:hypothetical protein
MTHTGAAKLLESLLHHMSVLFIANSRPQLLAGTQDPKTVPFVSGTLYNKLDYDPPKRDFPITLDK